jgi:hypothetical protein
MKFSFPDLDTVEKDAVLTYWASYGAYFAKVSAL